MSSSATSNPCSSAMTRKPKSPGRWPRPRSFIPSIVTPGRNDIRPPPGLLLGWLQPLLDPGANRLERLGQRRGVGAAGLRHVGTAAALAADLLRDVIDELARLHLRREVVGDARDQRHLAIGGAAEHDGRALELVL